MVSQKSTLGKRIASKDSTVATAMLELICLEPSLSCFLVGTRTTSRLSQLTVLLARSLASQEKLWLFRPEIQLCLGMKFLPISSFMIFQFALPSGSRKVLNISHNILIIRAWCTYSILSSRFLPVSFDIYVKDCLYAMSAPKVINLMISYSRNSQLVWTCAKRLDIVYEYVVTEVEKPTVSLDSST